MKSVFHFINSKNNLPYINMGSKAIPIASDSSSQLLMPRPFGLDPKVYKKRKRSQSPKNGSRSRSQSPNGRRARTDISKRDFRVELTSSPLKVKVVSPTLRGVTESCGGSMAWGGFGVEKPGITSRGSGSPPRPLSREKVWQKRRVC